MTVEVVSCLAGTSPRELQDIDRLLDTLGDRVSYIHSIAIDDLIEYFDVLGRYWKTSDSLRKKIGLSFGHLCSFITRKNLEVMLDTALRGSRKVLDDFVSLNDTPMLFHAQPRGLAVHWLAGNVPTLGVFSLIQSMLTKNVNLIKASSKAYDALLALLESFAFVNTEKVKGPDILQTVAVVLAGGEHKSVHEKLSLAADIRIAWGGREAIDTVLSYRKKFSAEDVVYGPKYSYAVIDKEMLSRDSARLAQKLAMDVSAFDQYACSSPHTVFVEKNGSIQPLEFAKQIAKGLDMVNRALIPKGEDSADKALEIHKIRSEYEFIGAVFASKNTDWTVIYSEEQGLADACFSRVIFVRPVDSIDDILKYSDRHKQTLGIAVDPAKKLEFIDRVTLRGLDRCPSLGTMSNFDSPWDGMFGIDRMVRWISTSGK